MSLSTYNKKRSFNKTPEPTGGKSAEKSKLVFVVQKHDASRLHYDFRLEMDGVLKSWAVPKGPSLNPEDKRLAMMVEDHPFDYREFEGIIPEGNYGAGTVMVWDEGTYEPLEEPSANKKENEKKLLKQLKSGSLKIVMYGKKLKGEFALVHTHYQGENSWLLIKHNDKYAAKTDVTKKDKSVITKRTLTQIEKKSDKVWKSNREQTIKSDDKKTTAKKSAKKVAVKAVKKKVSTKKESSETIKVLLKKAKKAAYPHNIKPMLATLTDKPFDDADWVYEIKWDGYRAVSYLQHDKVEIQSRNNQPFTNKFKAVTEVLQQLNLHAVFDGEIVALNDDGFASFQQLQNFANKSESVKLVYYVFDILWFDGKDISHLSLIERKTILQEILPTDNAIIKYSDHIVAKGKEFFKLATKRGLEGIMAKKADSEYTKNFRTKLWLKIKNNQRLEAIICGFTQPRKSRKHFGALILGKYEGSKLVYIGHTGTGFNDKSLSELNKKLSTLVTSKMPFAVKPKTNMPVTWIKPKLICEIKFSEVTDDGILRQPVFMGLRDDKDAKNEKNVEVVDATKRAKTKKASGKK